MNKRIFLLLAWTICAHAPSNTMDLEIPADALEALAWVRCLRFPDQITVRISGAGGAIIDLEDQKTDTSLSDLRREIVKRAKCKDMFYFITGTPELSQKLPIHTEPLTTIGSLFDARDNFCLDWAAGVLPLNIIKDNTSIEDMVTAEVMPCFPQYEVDGLFIRRSPSSGDEFLYFSVYDLTIIPREINKSYIRIFLDIDHDRIMRILIEFLRVCAETDKNRTARPWIRMENIDSENKRYVAKDEKEPGNRELMIMENTDGRRNPFKVKASIKDTFSMRGPLTTRVNQESLLQFAQNALAILEGYSETPIARSLDQM